MVYDSSVAARGACSHAVVRNPCHTQATCSGKASRHYESVNALRFVVLVTAILSVSGRHTLEIEMASERRTTSRNGTLKFRIIDAPFHTSISRCSCCHIRPRHRYRRCPTRLVRVSDGVTSVHLSYHVVNLPAPEVGIRKRCCMACWTAGWAGRVG